MALTCQIGALAQRLPAGNAGAQVLSSCHTVGGHGMPPPPPSLLQQAGPCLCVFQNLCCCVPCHAVPCHLPPFAGNFCVGGSQGRERGNGRIVVSEFNDKSGDECGWEVLKTVEIPSKAAFMDYSGMALRGDRVSVRRQQHCCRIRTLAGGQALLSSQGQHTLTSVVGACRGP